MTSDQPIVPPPQIPLALNMGWETKYNSTTAKSEAGIKGLWRKSKRMCKMALGWHLLRDLEERKIGTNEVENEAKRRTYKRELKKGYSKDIKEFAKSVMNSRDEKYITGLLRMRSDQAREDWEDARKDYREEKEKILREAKEDGCKNKVRRELSKIAKTYSKNYEEGRRRHSRKIDHLCRKYKKRGEERKRKEEGEESRRRWIQEVAMGTGRQRTFSRQVPI